MMISEIELMKQKFEQGLIKIEDLSEEEIDRLKESYKNEIEENEKEIQITKNKIKKLKEKIDNIV